ncbi:hypothetical protein K439DRAFT_1622101 [Ramaria rubella]|nr:hypothetical protein K439DRAFT_1622101 [Ramaria rubella]
MPNHLRMRPVGEKDTVAHGASLSALYCYNRTSPHNLCELHPHNIIVSGTSAGTLLTLQSQPLISFCCQVVLRQQSILPPISITSSCILSFPDSLSQQDLPLTLRDSRAAPIGDVQPHKVGQPPIVQKTTKQTKAQATHQLKVRAAQLVMSGLAPAWNFNNNHASAPSSGWTTIPLSFGSIITAPVEAIVRTRVIFASISVIQQYLLPAESLDLHPSSPLSPKMSDFAKGEKGYDAAGTPVTQAKSTTTKFNYAH